jgi:hypothetical protein
MASTLEGNLTLLGSIADLIVLEGARRHRDPDLVLGVPGDRRTRDVAHDARRRVVAERVSRHVEDRTRRFSRSSVGDGNRGAIAILMSVPPAIATALIALAALAASVRPGAGQTGRGSREEPAVIDCRAQLGTGVTTKREFCDVLVGSDPSEGIIVRIPPHTGPAHLRFDLHNRHTYSEQQVQAGRAFARYTATIGVLTLTNDLLARGVVQSEFRAAADLVDRIAGGAGPRGVKAVAPTGLEPIAVDIPQNVSEVSILGERLDVLRLEGREAFVSPGRPIASISNVTVEYRPAPARRSR